MKTYESPFMRSKGPGKGVFPDPKVKVKCKAGQITKIVTKGPDAIGGIVITVADSDKTFNFSQSWVNQNRPELGMFLVDLLVTELKEGSFVAVDAQKFLKKHTLAAE